MLWKQLNPAYRRLVRQGHQGEAVIVEVTADRAKGRIGGIYGWQVTLRVKFADGSTADYGRYLEAGAVTDGSGRSLLDPAPGVTLPIRYDPANRSKVEIDTAALAQQYVVAAAKERSQQDVAVQSAERDLNPLDR
jgi:hypothetical protein